MATTKYLMQTLNYSETAEALAACIRAKRCAMLISAPGLGKTAVTRDASAAVDLPCHDLIAANMDPTDIAGLPYRDLQSGRVLRELFPEIRAVCDRPGVLFLDEATTMPKSVEGPILRLALERNAGGTWLHQDSAVVLACNPPEHAPGGIELSAALINRIVVLPYAPSFDELRLYFSGSPVRARPSVAANGDYAKLRQLEWADFAATLAYDPSLVMMEPPRASIDAGEPWASPRGWEIGLDCLAAHGGKEDNVGYALLSGAVGPAAAGAYLAIRKLRAQLPSVDEIRADPATATVPEDIDHQIAALGILARVADTDCWAAWVYADRLKPEIGAACARVLVAKAPGKSKHARLGKDAMTALMAKIKRACEA